MSWWEINNAESIDSPALVIYPDRVQENINTLISKVADISLLRPHVKTNKSPEASSMMIASGIRKFKCATIAEAEMLGSVGAPDVLLAYQPTGPKAKRLAELAHRFPETKFSCLLDNLSSSEHLGSVMEQSKIVLDVFIDLNVGMNRTGTDVNTAFDLFKSLLSIKGIRPIGLHAYDGHLRDPDLAIRKKQCDDAFKKVEMLAHKIKSQWGIEMVIVAGGSPTFPLHAERKSVECSPGTFIYWDSGYASILKEQQFNFSAVVLSRVISKPSEGILCLDLGHKSIASENPLEKRVTFLNGPELIPVGQSEEHLVVKTDHWNDYHVGQLLYGIPYHVCPTVALYDAAWTVSKKNITGKWTAPARSRQLTV